MPAWLRPLFHKRRELFDEVIHAEAETVVGYVQVRVGDSVRPGLIVLLAPAGDLLQWHPTCTSG